MTPIDTPPEMNTFQEFGFVLVNECEEWTVTLAGEQTIQIKYRANQKKETS